MVGVFGGELRLVVVEVAELGGMGGIYGVFVVETLDRESGGKFEIVNF